MAVTPVTSVTSEIIVTDTQSDLTQPGEVEVWLRQALDSIQTAASVEADGEALGFTLEQIQAARAVIGATVARCLGVIYWRLPDAYPDVCVTRAGAFDQEAAGMSNKDWFAFFVGQQATD